MAKLCLKKDLYLLQAAEGYGIVEIVHYDSYPLEDQSWRLTKLHWENRLEERRALIH